MRVHLKYMYMYGKIFSPSTYCNECIYILLISHSLIMVYNSSVGCDWMSACKGSTGRG